jgi:hypothetical protein
MTGNRPFHKGGTYHQIAVSEAGAIGGRFAAEAKTHVTGVAPAPQYPTLPVNSPWADEPVGPEPPLGVAIDQMEPVGEPFEIQMDEARSGTGITPTPVEQLQESASSSGNERSARGPHPAALSAPLPPSTKLKSRKRMRP